MEFSILGPLDVRGERGTVALGGSKPRVVLAVLLLHPNEAVSADRLALALWGDDAPAGAAKTVQVHVSRLRKALGDPGVVETTPAGYRLRVGPDELDAQRFERGVDAGRRALAGGRPEEAAARLRDALALWRGPPLADLAFEPFAQAEIERLEEQRLTALEERVEADLGAGRHDALVAELRQLVAEHPTRERLVGQLMLALYRSGRQTEALDAFREARGALVEHAGVEPGPDLRRLHHAVLEQDPALEPSPAGRSLPPELDAAAAPPLAGRDAELARLREHWRLAAAGAGRLVALYGADGMGKTRLAAELAGEAHRAGAVVRFATGRGPAAAIVRALDDVRATSAPALLVVDDADRAAPGTLAAPAVDVHGSPALAIVTGHDAGALGDLGADDAVTLRPLDEAAVRSVARLAAPALDGGDVPAGELLEESGGVPRRLHEVVTRWAQREAARRVDASAGRTAAGRADLRSFEAELARDVIALRAADERQESPGDAGGPVVCPFKGLASFEVADAPYFFGRERLVAELVARLVGAPLLAVVGPSGSGKSSVVRAGLLPALAEGVLPGSERWTQVLMRPGEHPLREIRRLTDGLRDDAPAILAVDQFEEVFTVCRDERERSAFVAGLTSRDHGARVVVLAIRADHYGHCARYPELTRQLAAHHVLVGGMRRDELRRAVERPAARVGLLVDPELSDALVADVEHEPGALPMLSTALLELWQRRDGRHLRLSAYDVTGGVRGAVARHAEEAFGRLDPDQRILARRVLLRLVADDGSGGVERRRVALAELTGSADAAVARVVDVLADQRLLTVGAGAVELAHEALLREWPRLRGWVEEDAEGRRLRHHLAAAAREWEERGRDPGELYRGARLAAALEWRAAHEPELNAAEQTFLDASRGAAHAARARRRRALTLAVGALVVITGISVVVAVRAIQRARFDQRAAASRTLATRAVAHAGDDIAVAALLGLEAFRHEPTVEARSAVLSMLPELNRYRRIGRPLVPGVKVDAVAISPDGRTLAGAADDGTVRLWDMATQRPLGRPLTAHAAAVNYVVFSPDGRLLATAGSDRTIRLWRVADHRPAGRLLRAPNALVGAVAFSPDGRTLASEGDPPDTRQDLRASNLAGAPPGSITLWDVRSGRRIGRPLLARGERVGFADVAFSPDGAVLAAPTTDGNVELWDTASKRWLPSLGRRRGATLFKVAFSPDGRTLASVGDDGAVRLWDLATHRRGPAFQGHPGNFGTVAFSRDGRTVASGGEDGAVRLWNVDTGRSREVLRPPAARALHPQAGTFVVPRILGLAFAPRGGVLVSAGDDGVRLWDVGDREPVARSLRGHRASVRSLAFASGATLVSGGVDSTVRLWDARAGRALRAPLTQAGLVLAVTASPDGRVVASGGEDGTVRLWDTRSGRLIGRVAGGGSAARALAFTPDGRTLAIAGADATVRLWDVAARRPLASLTSSGGAVNALSINGSMLAAATQDGTVRLWDLGTRKPDGTLTGPTGFLHAAAFSPDGETLAAAGGDGSVWLWDVDARELLGQPLTGHTDTVESVAFSPDGRMLATAGGDRTVRLWDVASRQPLGAPLVGHTGWVSAVAFSRDGTRLASAGADRTVRLWDPLLWSADRPALERRVCGIVRRSLTRAEWARLIPDAPYHATCG